MDTAQINANWPITVWIGLIGTPLMIAGGQVLFKLVSARLPPGELRSIGLVAFDHYFIGAMLVYFVATVSWIYVLRSVPLGVAYSFTALGFIFVPIVSMYLFGELLTVRFLLGTIMVVAGLMVIHA